jgi:hypothetical protein
MFRSMASKVAWVGRTASMVFGLALVLALILGVGTMAVAAVPGDPFRLGQTNGIDNISTLVGSASGALLRINNEGSGPALDLRVESGEAPMNVNSTKRVNDLNVDKVDGKSAAQLGGVNGQQLVKDTSDYNSNHSKDALAKCPQGKVVVGTGYMLLGPGAGDPSIKMVFVSLVDRSQAPGAPDSVMASALETKPVAANWSVMAQAICATAGTP